MSKIVENVYDPERAVDTTLKMIRHRIDNPQTGISQHIPGTVDLLMPWRAGMLVAIVGYTSNGKTSFTNYMINQHAYQLRSYRKEHPDYNHVILYVTWEQTIEEQTVLDLSRVTSISANKIFKGELSKTEVEQIWDKGATDRRSLPVWLIGSSVNDSRSRKRFSMEEINEGLIYLEKECNVSVDLIVLDYLQRVRRSTSVREMREGFIDIVDQAKDMAIRCPVILLSQAGRQVRARDNQLPDLDDGQECLAGDTILVHGLTGETRTVKEWHELGEDLWLHTMQDDWHFAVRYAEKVRLAGVQDIYKVSATGGRTIRVSGNHPFYTSNGWKHADQLVPGDYVAYANRITVTWVKIQSVILDGKEETYDISVPPEHNFLANGFVVHNTSNLEQSSDHYYSVWMPSRAGRDHVDIDGLRYDTSPGQIVVGFLKQRQAKVAPFVRVFEMGIDGMTLTPQQGRQIPKDEVKKPRGYAR